MVYFAPFWVEVHRSHSVFSGHMEGLGSNRVHLFRAFLSQLSGLAVVSTVACKDLEETYLRGLLLFRTDEAVVARNDLRARPKYVLPLERL